MVYLLLYYVLINCSKKEDCACRKWVSRLESNQLLFVPKTNTLPNKLQDEVTTLHRLLKLIKVATSIYTV